MRKTIQPLIILTGVMLAVIWMMGCAEEETEKVTVATITEIIPPDGSEVTVKQEITITFDNPVTNVLINGHPAQGSGKSWEFQDRLANEIHITWTNIDGSAGEGKTINYTVIGIYYFGEPKWYERIKPGMTRSELKKVWGEPVETNHYREIYGEFDIWCYYAGGAWGIVEFYEAIYLAAWGHGNTLYAVIVRDTVYQGSKALTIYEKLYPYWCLNPLLIPRP